MGDIARFHRQKFNLPVIAVTGSNGKTTTKEMVAQVLSRRFKVLKNEGTKNNQIGVPLTLLKLDADDEMLVLELGTNHFGEIARLASVCQPNIGIITNIGPSHLEFLHDLKGAFKEKYTLIANLKPPHLAILNADDNLLKRKISAKNSKPAIFSFGVKHRSDFFAARTKHSGEKLEFLVNSKYKFVLRTLGDYNIYNALPAVAVARLFGMEYKDIALGLSKFEFPAGRLKLIKFKQVRFIDDTYNSNPLSLRQALNTLGNFKAKGRKILVMGDMLELGKSQGAFHADAACQIARVCHTFISVGQLSQIAASAARNCGFNPQNIFTCASSLVARDILFQQVVPREDDIVLVKGSRAMRMEEVFK